MAVNLLGGNKFSMPKRASSADISRIVERGQRAAGVGGTSSLNVSASKAHVQTTIAQAGAEGTAGRRVS